MICYSTSFRALACRRVLLRPCSAPPSLTAPNLTARAPRSPCRTRVTSRRFASGIATLFCASLHCCCRVVALFAGPLTFSLRVHPDASPRTPRTDRLWTSDTRARFLCAPHGFLCALCAAGALYWPDCLAYDLSFSHAYAVLCAAWLFLQRRLCAHLPRWRVLCWRLCYECFLLPRDGVHCRWIERAAAMLLECVHTCWKWCCWLF